MVEKGKSPQVKSPHGAGQKTARALWAVVWLCLFRPSPKPLHGYRCFLLKCFGAKLGRKVVIHNSVRIWAPWNLIMEEGSCLGPRVNCYSVATIMVGKKAVISQDVTLCAATHDYTDYTMPLIPMPIRVGEHVWVCAEAFIAPGITLGDFAVIGARAAVFKSVASSAVVGGNPAKVLKERVFKED